MSSGEAAASARAADATSDSADAFVKPEGVQVDTDIADKSDNSHDAEDMVAAPSENVVLGVKREGAIDASSTGNDTPQQEMSMYELQDAVEQIDENLDEAFGQAADTLWSFATSVTGKVTSAVKEGQPGLETLRKNVTNRLAPLDHIGRDISAQIGALAPDEGSLANITGSMKSVAESVQRNAEAMEAAIMSKANEGVPVSEAVDREGRGAVDSVSELTVGDPGVGVLPLMGGSDNLNVNDEIAKVGETISKSLVGQTVGDLWTGLWGTEEDGTDEQEDSRIVDVPKTRFEKRIFELQANPDTYCEPAKDLDAFEAWGKDFNLDNYADSCVKLLDTHDSIAELYERVVPRIVDEDTFWMRYYFAKHVLEKEEERRQKLLERAENAVGEDSNEDDGWGDDDWDDDVQVTAEDSVAATIEGQSTAQASALNDSSTPTKAEVERNVGTPDVDTETTEQVATTAAISEESKPAAKGDKKLEQAVGNIGATAEEDFKDDEWGDDDWE